MRIAKFFGVCLSLLAFSLPAFCKKKEVPKAPLPPVIRNAKTVFITNGGGDGTSLAFDEFYAEMKKWGRFQLAPSPSQADIVIDLKYEIVDLGHHLGSAYNSYTKQTTVYSQHVTDPQISLSISDAHSNALLWSTTDHRRIARFEKNREKETVKSADRLIEDLKERIASPE